MIGTAIFFFLLAGFLGMLARFQIKRGSVAGVSAGRPDFGSGWPSKAKNPILFWLILSPKIGGAILCTILGTVAFTDTIGLTSILVGISKQ